MTGMREEEGMREEKERERNGKRESKEKGKGEGKKGEKQQQLLPRASNCLCNHLFNPRPGQLPRRAHPAGSEWLTLPEPTSSSRVSQGILKGV